MKFAAIGSSKYILRFEKGEELISTLTKFCSDQHIDNGFFSGLGSVESPTLAHYLVSTKKYTEKKVEGVFELLNISGNVALFEDKPLIHAHVTLSDDQMNARGGHLVSAAISATVEINFSLLDSVIEKSLNPDIGLKLFDLPDSF